MNPAKTREMLIGEIEKLNASDQERVLAFTRGLSREMPKGEPGHSLLAMVGLIPPAELKEIEDAIEQDCERIDPSEW